MSEIEAINSGQPSFLEEAMNSMKSTSCIDCVNSSSNIDELQDKLEILERSSGNANPELIQSIRKIQNMIENGDNLNDIKKTAFLS